MLPEVSQGELREEWEAKWAVSTILRGVPERCNPPGHDYDVRVGDRVIALEVTKSAPKERAALHAAIRRLHERQVGHITMHWQVWIPDAKRGFRGPDLRPIFDQAPPLLRVLEQHGVWGFGRGYELQCRDKPDLVPSIRALYHLGLIAGHAVGPLMPKECPLLLVGTTGEGGMVDANEVNGVAELCATKKLDQLSAADAHERHLFIIVESTDYAANAALTAGFHLPDRPPRLPEGVDTVWVGAWVPRSWCGCDISPIWRATPPNPWTRVQLPDAHSYASAQGESFVLNAEEQAREVVRDRLNDCARDVVARVPFAFDELMGHQGAGVTSGRVTFGKRP
jgi:hypothetical protein